MKRDPMHNGPLLPDPPIVVWKEALVFVLAIGSAIWIPFNTDLSALLSEWAGFPEPSFRETEHYMRSVRRDIVRGFGSIAIVAFLPFVWLIGKSIGARFTNLAVILTALMQSREISELLIALVKCEGLSEIGSAVCTWQTHSEYLFDPIRIYSQYAVLAAFLVYIVVRNRRQRPFATPVKP